VKKREAVAAAFASTVRELRVTGFVSRQSIADELNRRRVPTERDGRWHYTTVARMLTRLGMEEPAGGIRGAGAVVRWAANARAEALAPILCEIQSAGIVTLKAITSELNARGVPTPHGGKWYRTSVHRLLRRLERLAARSKSHGKGKVPALLRARVPHGAVTADLGTRAKLRRYGSRHASRAALPDDRRHRPPRP
jgi:hypothetical protein